MASYAGLVLYKVALFDENNFPEYSCTGRRNHGANFRLNGAMTHRFCKAKKSRSLNTGEVINIMAPHSTC